MNKLTAKCECEHESHFCYANTPNGNPAHKYGVYYAQSFITPVKTPFGTFNVCKDCAEDCYHPDNLELVLGILSINNMSRFQVVEHSPRVWKVEDTEYKKWNMPKMAVSIFFGSEIRAQQTANQLNNEWYAFLRNPS